MVATCGESWEKRVAGGGGGGGVGSVAFQTYSLTPTGWGFQSLQVLNLDSLTEMPRISKLVSPQVEAV